MGIVFTLKIPTTKKRLPVPPPAEEHKSKKGKGSYTRKDKHKKGPEKSV